MTNVVKVKMFKTHDAIKQKAKTDPAIWRKMAIWISKVSPATAAPIILNKQ